jgi:hypothetical protein
MAAKRGHLEVLKWARANGCPWTSDTCSYAAKGGHLQVLKWARANGCPWNWHAYRLACRKKRRGVVHGLKANGGPTAEATDDDLYTWTSGEDEWDPSDSE